MELFRLADGHLIAPRAPGLGVRLAPETERRYAFRDDAVYRCATAVPPTEPGRWRTR
ncbi:hypothetical protein [Streptomyces sp. NPDC057545]|uniref:hypothetical protein n=1 Tax=unclassified Streptomyces TaxID=2593676 RepID=UPI00368843DE